jgi:ComEC/Rec2-related protein
LCIKGNLTSEFFFGLLSFWVFGIWIGTFRTHNIAHNIDYVTIDHDVDCKLTGIVEHIKPTVRGLQITISDVTVDHDTQNYYSQNYKQRHYKKSSGEQGEFVAPYTVKLNISRYDGKYVMLGDKITVDANIHPPMEAVVPGGFDFRRVAFFNQIGAIGNAKSLEIIGYIPSGPMKYVQHVRRIVYEHLIQGIGIQNGNFAAAILIGETGGISKKILNDMRYAGISHILCVSGLHLSLVAMILFTSVRFILNISDYVSERYNVKNVAAYIAIIGSAAYLFLSGVQIAATRAFVMTAISIWAIIIRRSPYPMRSLVISAFVLLILNPEYVVHPSFQLSYVAVVSLICGYEFFTKYMKRFSGNGWFGSGIIYLLSNIYSTVIASIATAPIVMYHFYIFSNYAIFANLVAVPLMSFIMMPFGILGTLLIPFGLSKYPFIVMSYGIDIVQSVAAYLVELPYSLWNIGMVDAYGITLLMFGFFWIAFWSSSIRWYGLWICLLGTIWSINVKQPTFIVNFDKNIFAANRDGVLTIYGNKVSRFIKDYWTYWFGQSEALYKNVRSLEGLESIVHDTVGKSYGVSIDFPTKQVCVNDVCNTYMDQNVIVGYCSSSVLDETLVHILNHSSCKISYNIKQRFISKH